MATSSSPPEPPPPPLPQEPPPHNPNHHLSPSSPSSSPPPSNLNSPKPLQSISLTKKPLPSPWSHLETVNLIQAYQEKWYSLKRGQLKANQWEEVAITVAARCGFDEPSKTATQCRHKIEKLRKRYRAEKQKPNPRAWEYFDFMHCLEHGPLPISARPIAMIRSRNPNHNEIDEEEAVNLVNFANYNEAIKGNWNKSKNINRIVRENASMNRPVIDRKLAGCSTRISGFLQKPLSRKKEEMFERYQSSDDDNEDEVEEEEEEGEDENDGSYLALAAEIKAFAERFVRMEKKKMEMMKETQRYRMEMENKRIEMMIESQRKIVDTIGRAFGSQKKMKMADDI